MEDISRVPQPNGIKVFIQRDYTDGTPVRFQSKFPPELEGRIERSTFAETINTINEMYKEAESLGGSTYCESCFACLTAYLSYLCVDTHYEKCLKKIGRYIENQNQTIYVSRGLVLVDPAERGLRTLEICILQESGGPGVGVGGVGSGLGGR
ncbi:golgin subfamily A member 7-like [Argonauta hians]